MKATITREGFIKITPGNDLEDFALACWMEENPAPECNIIIQTLQELDEEMEDEPKKQLSRT